MIWGCGGDDLGGVGEMIWGCEGDDLGVWGGVWSTHTTTASVEAPHLGVWVWERWVGR